MCNIERDYVLLQTFEQTTISIISRTQQIQMFIVGRIAPLGGNEL